MKNLGLNCKIHEHQPTERIPERVMLQYTSAVESGDSASEPSRLWAAKSSSEGEKGWGHRQGVPKYVHMSSNESLHHCVCACVLQHTSAVESGSSASETVVLSPLLGAESSFEGEEGIISEFQTMSVVQGSVELASTDSTCSISVPITRLRSTLTLFGKGGTGLDDNPGSTL